MIRYICISFLLLAGCFAEAGRVFVGGFERGIVPSEVYRPRKPLMWGAKLKVDRAMMVSYEKEVYHLGRYVEFYGGVSGGFLQKVNGPVDSIQILGGYLMARIYFVKASNFQMFIMWSPAGPSFLTKSKFVTTEFSNRFVFQDQFGIGATIKGGREYELFAKLYHFSNGDIFPVNGGIDIPLLIGIGVRL